MHDFSLISYFAGDVVTGFGLHQELEKESLNPK
jgi:hypothetical protein